MIRTLTKECGYGVAQSVKMLTKNPAEIFGLNKGEIAIGKDADIVVFDDDINVQSVFVNGEQVK